MKYSPNKRLKSVAEVDSTNTVDDNKVELIESPNYILFYTAQREGVDATGQTDSILSDPDMAKAEAITRLMDLGYTEIHILAIETAGKKAQSLDTTYNSPTVDIAEVFAD